MPTFDSINRNRWRYTRFLRRILFALPGVRTLVLRRHASALRKITGMVIQEVSLPYQEGDPLGSVRDAERLGSSGLLVNTAVERTSKRSKRDVT